MTKQKNKFSQTRAIWLAVLGLFGLGLVVALLLSGTDVALFSPKGLIAKEEHNLILLCSAMLLTMAVPTLIIFYGFAWEYRESNPRAIYDPNLRHGKWFNFSLWAVPFIFMLVLASVMWPATHRLDTKKAIVSDVKPMTIQVVALRWKWLFIYPDQKIATVNFVEIPTDTPVQFVLTADEAPMSSFSIPHLGGQLYAMTGHANQINMIADEAGDYMGRSAEINGPGFSGMTFTARASTHSDFDQWVKTVQASPDNLNASEYADLLKPSENNKAISFASVDTTLYTSILTKYMGSHHHRENG